MDSFTLVDGGVAALVLISGILAYSRGFVREVMAIVGWIVAAVAAFFFAHRAEPLVLEIPYVSDFLSESCELSIIAAFAVVFALALIVMTIFTPLFSSAVQRSAISGVDQGLGFLFGVLRGLVLVVIGLFVYKQVVLNDPIPMVENSQTARIFANVQEKLNEQLPSGALDWVTARYEELVSDCNAPKTVTTTEG